jgi:hypothetical protein
VLTEMLRVCRSAGRVAVVDLVVPDPEHAEDYNHRERLRDPSHTRALTVEQLSAAMRAAGLETVHLVERDQPIPLERWLSQANAPDAVASQLRAELEAELAGGPPTGMRARRDGDELYLTQRWVIAVARSDAEG